MAITTGEYAQYTARLNVARLATFRLGAVMEPNEMDSDGLYIWAEDDSDLSSATWTEDTSLT